MRVFKDKGFKSENLNETLGLNKIEVEASGFNNKELSFIKINNTTNLTNSRRGITVVLYNDDMTLFNSNTFDTHGSVTAINELNNHLKNLPSNKYIIIYSWDAHQSNNALLQTMLNFGAVKYTEIPRVEEYYNHKGYLFWPRSPYCAIGTTDIGIVYESLGTQKEDALFPNANLNVFLPEIRYVGVQGYGENLIATNTYELKNGEALVYEKIQPTSCVSEQHFKFSYSYQITSQDINMNDGLWVRVDRINNTSGNIVDTVYDKFVTSAHKVKEWGILKPLRVNETYRVSVVPEGNTEATISLKLVKSSKDNPLDDKVFGRVTEDTISGLTLRNTMFGVEPYYADIIKETFETTHKVFNNDLPIPLYHYSDTKGRLVNGNETSAYIPINANDETFVMNFVAISSQSFQPRVTVHFYDSSYNLIIDDIAVSYTNDLDSDTPYIVESFMFKSTISDRNDYSMYQNLRYGYDTKPTTNKAITIPDNTRYIKFTFSKNTPNNYYAVFPCASIIKPLVSADHFISPTFFNDSVIPITCDSPELTVTKGKEVFLEEDAIYAQIPYGSRYTYDQRPPIPHPTEPDYYALKLVYGDNEFYNCKDKRHSVELTWSLDGYGPYDEIRVYESGYLREILPPNTESWVDPYAYVSKNTYYEVYFIKGERYCLSEGVIEKAEVCDMTLNGSLGVIRASGLVFRTTMEAEFYMSYNVPPSASEILNTWPRARNTIFFPTPADATGQSADWYYDSATDRFIQPNNTAGRESLLSPTEIDEYFFTTIVTSSSGDDDAIGIVLAAQNDGNEARQLYAWVNAGGFPNRNYSFYVEYESTDTGKVVIDGNDVFSRFSGGWRGKRVKVDAIRNGSNISVVRSDWDLTGTMVNASRIDINLNSLPGSGSSLAGKARYGFCTYSQPGSTYEQFMISSSSVYEDDKVYSEDDNLRWVYDDSTGVWNQIGTAYSDFSTATEVINPLTKEYYDVGTSTLNFKMNNGISYGDSTVSVGADRTTVVPSSNVTSQYSYIAPMTVMRTFVDSNVSTVVDSDTELSVTANDTDGYFYVLLETPPVADADSGTFNKTIAYRKVLSEIQVYEQSAYYFKRDIDAELFRGIHVPTSPEEILNTWPRVQNNDYYPDPTTITVSPANQWYVDTTLNSIVQPVNTPNHQHIVSPVKLDNYEFEATLTADTSDGDNIGLVAAADYINGEFVAVSAIIHTGGQKHLPTLALVYFDSTVPTGSHKFDPQVLVGNNFLEQDPIATTVSNTNPDYGWWNRAVKVKITRNGTIINVIISDWNGTTYDSASALSYDLSDLTGNGNELTKPARYGFFSNSTANSTYLDYKIRSGGVGDDSIVYSWESNQKWEYDGSTWSITGNAYDDFVSIDRIINPVTKEQFLVNSTYVDFEINNGISYGEYNVTIPMNSSTGIPSNDIVSNYTFTRSFDVTNTFKPTNLSASVLGSDVVIDTIGVDGSLYVMLETNKYVDPITNIDNVTLAFRKVNVTVSVNDQDDGLIAVTAST